MQLHVPSKIIGKSFIQNAVKAGLINVVTRSEPHLTLNVRVDPLACACSASPDHLVVNDDTVTIFKDSHIVKGYPIYFLPSHISDEEVVTLVTWLTQHKFHTFTTKIEDKTLKRTLSRNIFSSYTHPHCENCTCFKLIGEPLFLLKHIALSVLNKGPTVESISDVSSYK